MRCEKVKEMLSLYIDNELDGQKRNEIENHLQVCEECSREHEDLLIIKKLLSETPQVELPEGFKDELHKKLVECNVEENDQVIDFSKTYKRALRNKKKFNWKVLSGVAAAIFLMVISVSSLKDNNFKTSEIPKMEMKEAAPEENIAFDKAEEETRYSGELTRQAPMEYNEAQMDGHEMSIVAEDRGVASQNQMKAKEAQFGDGKIIFGGYLQLEVEDYDSISKKITDLATLRGGYTENSNTSNEASVGESTEKSLKTRKIVIRIPQNDFHNIFYEISNMGTVVNENISSIDISLKHSDVSEELVNLEEQEKRLQEVTDKEENSKNVSKTESELTRVREEITELKENLKQWSDLVELSTIEIDLEEMD